MENRHQLTLLCFLGAAFNQCVHSATPCPDDANLWACADWCKVASPGSSGTLSGSVCSHMEPELKRRGHGPSCTCYDSNFETVLASCTSKCPSEEPSHGGKEEKDSLCDKGDSECDDALSTATRRFILYDVKMGEGFNLQREIFPRVGWVVWELNKKVRRRCGSAFSAGACSEWVLVLPPWCRVAHWRRSTSKHVYWRELFDTHALKSSKVKVLEFDEYVKEVGSPFVDLAITHTDDRISKSERFGQKGGFYGWAKRREACTHLADHQWEKKLQRRQVSYAGDCEEGVLARDYRCAVLASTMVRDIVDMFESAGKLAVSVLIKRADSIHAIDSDDQDKVGLREAMLFAQPIRDAGEEFIRDHLGGRRYVAAHCRRTDFLMARIKTTPGVEDIAKQLNLALTEQAADQVFIATDAPNDLRETLRTHVTGTVVFFDDASGIRKRLPLEGQVAAVEMWIAARANYFIGTQESRFTSHIQLERSWLGIPKEKTEQEFCKTAGDGNICRSPAYRHSGKKGAQHRQYWHQEL